MAMPRPRTSRKTVTITVYSNVNQIEGQNNLFSNTLTKLSGKFTPRLPPSRLQREQAITTSSTIGTKNRTTIINQSGSEYNRPRRVSAAFALDLCTGTAPALLETLDMFLSPLGNNCEMVITESECNPMSGLRGRRTPKPRQHTAFKRYVMMKEEKE